MSLAEGDITKDVVANVRPWKHSGFSADPSVRLVAGDPEGVRRLIQFQVFDPLDFMAEVTQPIPDPGEHLIRHYGWYSNKTRGNSPER